MDSLNNPSITNKAQTEGFVRDCRNSKAIAMELL